MIARRPGLPEMPFDRKNDKKHRPPVIADKIISSNDIFSKIPGEIMPVLDVAVFENEIIIVPKHLVGKAVTVDSKTNE